MLVLRTDGEKKQVKLKGQNEEQQKNKVTENKKNGINMWQKEL